MSENKKIQKGLVVDVLAKERKVIVLMPDGDIQKVKPNRRYEIGEEISFKQEIVIRKVLNWGRVIRYASALSLVLILVFANSLFSIWNSDHPKDVYAEIFIESKSDAQVKLNKEQEVVEANPLNKPGARVIDNLDHPEGEPVGDFIDDYFEEMKKQGYIGPEDKAIISVVSDDHIKIRDEILRNVKEAINQSNFIKSNEIEVLTVSIPYQTAVKADQLGVTPGKFSLAMIADSVGAGNTVPLGILKVMTVTELVDANPEATRILSGTPEVELVELTEQLGTDVPVETEEKQPVTAMTSPAAEQTVKETTVQNTSEPKNELAIQGSTASSEKPKPVENRKSTKGVSSTTGNSKPEQTPPTKGNEMPSESAKDSDEQKPAGEVTSPSDKQPAGEVKPPTDKQPAGEVKPPTDKQPAGEVKPPTDKQPADSDQDGNTGSEEKPAEDDGKQNEEDTNDKNPSILDQVVSLVLNLKVL
ncbi:anti-sigma factor domain-containing protein [Thermoactinomyces mirandus]|uniref:Anti-sigma factor domain-containing protein n=1 Tax=Thermoactinomyces mirandus TaxID=2756294 RepID=A0A7W1XV80_9BACL|nr:anti-sigma factor domain-containing protein [Thermoactinomyces mirandus]MBA4603808.1 anti-sigma factor domain-containing protein [Thermoactinomyces mirandus]